MKLGNTCSVILLEKAISSILLPLFTGIKAGFPSPASDFTEPAIDLTKLLIPRPASTFFMKVDGDSMIDAGIFHEALIIVDRSIELKDDQIFVCYLDGEFTVKRVKKEKGKLVLYSANANYKPIIPGDESNFILWGKVTYAINPTT